ncbi:uncharacterized protein LOC105440258 [Strongylocentrotus purpuratus]|uniref:Uncharacterized protein n=1 Tax=Strongylocentrotus purpuratus TaxID=7668 RepID=A0A7M7NPB0_STRPU|nr:uncharacterized protein LOC105440258 [Strongylocentrotus purpuratus]
MKQLCAILLTVLVFGAVLADAVRRQERRDTRLDRRDTRRETRRTEMRRDMRRDMRRETRRDTRRDERRDERRRLSFKLGEDSGLEILGLMNTVFVKVGVQRSAVPSRTVESAASYSLSPTEEGMP